MADSKTWIDVADTAIKIGMGTLLGGGFAIWRAHLGNQNQARKIYLDKKRELIEKVLDDIDAVYASATIYWANLSNAVFMRDGGRRLTAKETDELNNLERQLFGDFKIFGFCSSRLLLVGEEQAEQSLRDLRNAIDGFFKIGSVANDKCTQEVLQSHRDLIQAKRLELFASLHSAYKRAD
jgi:hypothetical protein